MSAQSHVINKVHHIVKYHLNWYMLMYRENFPQLLRLQLFLNNFEDYMGAFTKR